VPSAEQINNRRKGRAEDRIPQTAQDRIGLLTFTVRNKALDSLACKTGGQPPAPHPTAAGKPSQLPRRLIAWWTKHEDRPLTADSDLRDQLDQGTARLER
jgi:hypothetical protein